MGINVFWHKTIVFRDKNMTKRMIREKCGAKSINSGLMRRLMPYRVTCIKEVDQRKNKFKEGNSKREETKIF